MAKFTVTRLRSDIEYINDCLAEFGFSVRLECGGRNGYQAVDEYSVNPDGSRCGTGVNCNICCGSPRECSDAAYAQLLSRLISQLCDEINENPLLLGTFEVLESSISGGVETHKVRFSVAFDGGWKVFKEVLQKTYDDYGMEGDWFLSNSRVVPVQGSMQITDP
jgi:hypothetical protein